MVAYRLKVWGYFSLFFGKTYFHLARTIKNTVLLNVLSLKKSWKSMVSTKFPF